MEEHYDFALRNYNEAYKFWQRCPEHQKDDAKRDLDIARRVYFATEAPGSAVPWLNFGK